MQGRTRQDESKKSKPISALSRGRRLKSCSISVSLPLWRKEKIHTGRSGKERVMRGREKWSSLQSARRLKLIYHLWVGLLSTHRSSDPRFKDMGPLDKDNPD